MRVLCASIVVALGCLCAADDPQEFTTVDSVVAALYDVVSGEAGEDRDWERMESLFYPGTKLMPISTNREGKSRPVLMTVEDYIGANSGFFKQSGFFENEIKNITEEYGRMAHVWTTYEARRNKDDDKPFMRGINSVQLVNDGERWWIINLTWYAENGKHPLPKKYLPDNS